jgi:hypothetical protein
MSYKVQKPCRVCGKLYTPCSDCENDKEIFRWRTVACSYECGQEYLKRVLEARSDKKDVKLHSSSENKANKKDEKKTDNKSVKNIKEREKID